VVVALTWSCVVVVFVFVVANPSARSERYRVMLHHERLDTYQLSLQFVAAAIDVSASREDDHDRALALAC